GRRRRRRADGGGRRDRVPPAPGLAPLLRPRNPGDRAALRRAAAQRRGRPARGRRMRARRPAAPPGARPPGGVGRGPARRGRVPAVRRRRRPQGAARAPGPLRRRPAALRRRLGRRGRAVAGRRGGRAGPQRGEDVTGGHVAHGGDLLGWLLPVAVLLLAVACGRAVHGRRAAGRAWSRWRTASAVAGLVALAVAVAPPLQAAAHADLRAHIAQHLLLGMFAPLLLVLSAPATLLIGALPAAGRRRVAALLGARPLHVAAHPVTAALLDVGGLHLLYLTPLYRLAHDVPAVHAAVMLHVVLA